MRLLFVSLLVLVAAVALALFIQEDTGHVVIAYGDWVVETSFTFFIVVVLATFIALYAGLRLWSGVRLLPHQLRRWRRRRRNVQVQNSYVRGMNALAEGRWEDAEKWLLKYVGHSEMPALHYLAAAEAAEAQGSQVRRDSYLRAAATHDPGAEVAVGLAWVKYHLVYRRPGDATAILDRLRALQPKHPTVLKRLADAYIAESQWQSLLALIPELERHRLVQGGKLEELQATVYRALFAEASLAKDAALLRALWENAPRAIKRHEEVLYDYARALAAVDPQAGDHLEPLLAEAIGRRWSDALVEAYGLVVGSNAPAQLAVAERWLKFHSENPVLLLTLGRLCVRSQLWGKGRSYLEASLAIEPQVEAYRELGALLERLNNSNGALECYRTALALVPGQFFPTAAPPARARPPATVDTPPLLPAGEA